MFSFFFVLYVLKSKSVEGNTHTNTHKLKKTHIFTIGLCHPEQDITQTLYWKVPHLWTQLVAPLTAAPTTHIAQEHRYIFYSRFGKWLNEMKNDSFSHKMGILPKIWHLKTIIQDITQTLYWKVPHLWTQLVAPLPAAQTTHITQEHRYIFLQSFWGTTEWNEKWPFFP